MDHRNTLGLVRRARPDGDFALLLAGCIGLAAAAFTACGGDDDLADTEDGGTTTTSSSGDVASSSGATGGGSSGAASSSGGTGAGGTCTTTTDTAANAAEVATAANALLALLTDEQKGAIQLEATAANAEQWSNLPTDFIARNGVMLGDLSSAAQDAAAALVAAAAGTQGGTLFSELRAADEWLVTDGNASASSYGAGRYYVSFHGTPSASGAWMLQVAGHHLAYNFTYNGACTSATPLFDGSEPMDWTDESGTVHAPVGAQRSASIAVIQAIAANADAQLAGTYTDVVNGPTNANGKGDSRYPNLLTYPTGSTGRGVLVSSLDAATQALVKTAMEAWVKNVADSVSTALLAEYESEASLAQTYVAYSGASDLSSASSYFRIDGPRVWIEVTVQGGIIYHDVVHFHTIWRDKAADYGAEYIDSVAEDAGTGGGGPGGGGPGGGGPGGDGGFPGMP